LKEAVEKLAAGEGFEPSVFWARTRRAAAAPPRKDDGSIPALNLRRQVWFGMRGAWRMDRFEI
jgi:hypothetical protein